MANRLHCYICDGRFSARTMSRIDGEENAAKLGIAVQRRDAFNRPPLEVKNLTRLCINCNQSVREEIQAIEEDPSLYYDSNKPTSNQRSSILEFHLNLVYLFYNL
ncbi:hypothetical protein TSAR_008925 [Trichomalopsis sarcophagae]|uniref:Uncharacterized protein n=1 Tax=Trichomalopsis sarcophagae TaxID=543379 RepID=A0A232EDX0_9HYME|nr:hypothetical protein TSAR_008925 [Trichomalopsis sarcophagae]